MITHITPRESAIAAIAADYQHEALAYSITVDNQEDQLNRLQGEASANGKYTQLPCPDLTISECPVCGSAATLWQYEHSNGAQKIVMCSNGESFGPQDCEVDAGCLLYLPPQDFYKSRIVDAIKFWNDYAKALTSQRITRNWHTHKALRKTEGSAV